MDPKIATAVVTGAATISAAVLVAVFQFMGKWREERRLARVAAAEADARPCRPWLPLASSTASSRMRPSPASGTGTSSSPFGTSLGRRMRSWLVSSLMRGRRACAVKIGPAIGSLADDEDIGQRRSMAAASRRGTTPRLREVPHAGLGL